MNLFKSPFKQAKKLATNTALILLSVGLITLQSCGKKSNDDPAPDPGTGTGTTGNGLPSDAVVGISNLTQWNTYKANSTASAYSWAMIGDSYTQGDYFTWRICYKLFDQGFGYGGPGYCSFSRWDPIQTYSMNQSIDRDVLNASYDLTKWDFHDDHIIAINGSITDNAANNVITVNATTALSTMTIIYEKHTTAESFRYRVNGGAWATVNISNTTPAIGSTDVDVSAAGTNFKVDIEPLNANMNFIGVIGKNSGNKLIMHKCGMSGSTASQFGENDEWGQSVQLLSPNGVVIEFGINEQLEDDPPTNMKASVQNIINKVRAISPNCDIILMSPPQTTYETENPHKYKQADYALAMYQLSQDNKTAFVNLSVPFGAFSQATVDKDLIRSDRIHPGDAGGELIANTLFTALKK